jgi:pyruvate kinase
MYEEGMNGIRINTAYGNTDQYQQIIDNTRNIANIPIILDIKGPEIRLKVKQKKQVKKGDKIEVGFNNEGISFNHDFYDAMYVSDRIYIDNGKIKTKVIKMGNRKLHLLVINDGEISNGNGANIPNKQLSIPTLSKKDKELISFADKNRVEFIAISFTRNAEDVRNLKSIPQSSRSGVIAKIENFEGLINLKEILVDVDGIMVARGDLGVEIAPEKVPLAQKRIIKMCNQEGKIVVTATEMLESMIYQPMPTRAEVSDIANAILDGTDAIMLSGETSIGIHPVEAVSMMSRIAKETDPNVKNRVEDNKFINTSDTISKAIQRLCQSMPVDKIVTLTRSGYTARMISRLKVSPQIIAVTAEEKIKRQLELVYNVFPIQIDYKKEKDRILAVASKLRNENLLFDSDIVIFTAASRTFEPHASNLIEVHKIEDLIKTPNV